jgi:uncharacterized protein YeaO (DUF488 family)
MVLIQRAPIRRHGVEGVDITVKSALGPARDFAPTWDMVMGSKQGKLSWDEYTQQYYALLDDLESESWDWLYNRADRKVLTVLCYCPDGKKCHTYLLMDYVCDKFPDRFFSIMYTKDDFDNSEEEYPGD